MAITSIDQLSPERRAQYEEDLANLRKMTPADVTVKSDLKGKVFTSGLSQITPEVTNINRNILGLRTEGAGMAKSSLENVRQTKEDVLGDRKEFISGKTAGLRKALGAEQESLTSRLEKTGVGGEFGRQTKESFAETAKQKLAQGEQMAIEEFASLSNNLDNIEGGILRLMEGIDFSGFTQDLQARGLSQDLKNQLTRIEQGRIGRDQAEEAQDRQEAGNWLMLFSQLFS